MTRQEILEQTQQYFENTNDNIIGVGYGFKISKGVMTDEKALVFTVKEKKSKELLTEDELLPSQVEINGQLILTDVIQRDIKLICDPTFYAWIDSTPANRNSIRPLKGGISASAMPAMSAYTGTLGFLALDSDTNTLVGVSNNHVFVKDAFICSERNYPGTITNFSGNTTSQPHETLSDNYPIGIIKRYYPISSIGYNYVDVALTTIRSGVTDFDISYKQEGLSDSIIGTGLDFASTAELDNLLDTDPYLYSAGRTTGAKGEGITKLRVASVGDTILIAYNKQEVSTVVYFSDLIKIVATTGTTRPFDMCLYPIWHGDSGSALIADINGTTKIVGLCFAGDDDEGFACRIDNIADLIKISAWKGESSSFSTEAIEEYTINGLSDQISITISGKTYWQSGLRSL